ncbi:uncharacterized protein GGS22DRAFT_173651 [Annulohypoxylon maeteangense]|uniref:uncharacterized protein n=1 Tax=Annulohypoxylon maeteangense TaxID=1927788 RepID=UPI002008BB1A|nr:uncharacterized protein GGS22DRAFT_173651 [Annulohypoxylon maeteangense]KAI0880868.1 hypothetical protein GGS22DRAFT_173651 [Annulohypoxylon maeteangense]
MRSHPYTPPPPLPPLLNDLSTYLPNRDRRDDVSGTEVGMSDLDPETSRLLPEKRRQHRVRIQGRLAPVRSVSIANLRSPSPRDTVNRGFDKAVGGTLPRRRRSEDDGIGGRGDEVSEEETEVEERDTQLRGYGIGGRGNIRRPTEVIGTSSKTSRSISSLFSSSGPGSSSGSPRGISGSGLDKRWTFSGLLNRFEERRGRERNV